jgi:hypothetical protein
MTSSTVVVWRRLDPPSAVLLTEASIIPQLRMNPAARVEFFKHAWAKKPDMQKALELGESLQIPTEWVIKVVRHIEAQPTVGAGSTGKILRFLTADNVNISQSKLGFCRLCDEEVPWPKKYWHSECWEAVYPFTAKYWKRVVSIERRRRGRSCQTCGNKGRMQADHILAVGLGGSSTANNLQFLCRGCHHEKTVNDVRLIRASKKNGADPTLKVDATHPGAKSPEDSLLL